MNTQQLQQQIQETQSQLAKLQAELEKAELADKFSQEFYTPIETNGDLKFTLMFLKDTSNRYALKCAFPWDNTPQGHPYWEGIWSGARELSTKDTAQIQTWVINYMIQKEGI